MTNLPEFRKPAYTEDHGSHRQYLDFFGALYYFTKPLTTVFVMEKVEKLYTLGILEFQLRTGVVEVGSEAEIIFERTEQIYAESEEYITRNPEYKEAILKMSQAVREFST